MCEFLEFGWLIGYEESHLPVTKPHNHNSAFSFCECVDSYISKQVYNGTIMGPFDNNPFNAPLTYSPFQTVPKKGTEERRVVCDLSFPWGKSVNDGIPCGTYLGEESHITYPKVDNLVSIIKKHGQGCLMWKRDLKSAYRQLPLDPHDYHLLAYTWRGLIYIDLAIPFGLRTGSLAMQRTTNAFVYIMYKQNIDVVGYIDDYAGANSRNIAQADFESVGEYFSLLGLVESPEKAISPTTEMEFLGILFNTVDMTYL